MRFGKPTRVVLERLEDRCCPSNTITLDAAGNLTIQTDNNPPPRRRIRQEVFMRTFPLVSS
jgi:hypothetical protein